MQAHSRVLGSRALASEKLNLDIYFYIFYTVTQCNYIGIMILMSQRIIYIIL